MVGLRGTSVGALLAIFVALGIASASSARAIPTKRECPRAAISSTAGLEVVTRHAKQLIPHYYHYYGSGPSRIINGFRLVGGGPELPGTSRLRKIVWQVCGWPVAERSWAVGVVFPHNKLSSAAWIVFMTPTKRGWVMWGSIDPRDVFPG